MSKHLYRTLFIWATIVIAFIYVYPTVGWMLLSEESRAARLAKWQEEDDQLARRRTGYWEELFVSAKRWAQFDREKVINLGLDLQGGIHMVIGFDTSALPKEVVDEYKARNYSDADIEKEVQQIVLDQITRRINDFEAKEPIVQTLGTNQIQVQLPGEKDVQRAKNLITKTAQMNFHIVVGPDQARPIFEKIRDAFPEEFLPYVKVSSLRPDVLSVTQENYDRVRRLLDRALEAGVIPEDKIVAFSQKPKPYDKDQDYQLYVIDKEPIASGSGLTSASAIQDQSNPPYWQILFSFNSASAADFADATGKNIGKPMAIVLDGVVVSAPTIQDRIAGGRGQITGSFEPEEANDLAIALNSGSMVVPVREEFTRTVSASLGSDTVRSGVISSIGSIILVAIFMCAYYFGAGLIACICLALNAIMILALMAYFDMTLTLPGIAGLILTMGMAVDGNVLIYERIREELKRGHTMLASIDAGFNRAAITILDSNITTLIAGAILMQFGTGPIEGFAITLCVGIFTSVFTALVIGRALFDFGLERKIFKKIRMLDIFPTTPKVKFLEVRNYTFIFSGILIFVSMGYFVVRGMDNFGVDFQQGTNLVLHIDNPEPVNVGDVRDALTGAGFNNPVVQESSDEAATMTNVFIVRVGDVTRSANDKPTLETVGDRIRATLAPLSAGKAAENIVVESEQTVGPAVGAQLRWDALNALFWALLAMIVYMWIRFDLKYSIGGVAALLHDVLVAVGVFSIVGGYVSMNVIAALLTILGFSINDTIVIFDRVREERQLRRGQGMKFMEILNEAINLTLSRTFLTSLTVLVVVVVLVIFGGDAINDFAVVLLIGVISGVYSTVYVATALVYVLQGKGDEPASTRARRQVKEEKVSADEAAPAAPKRRPRKGEARA